jgi:hypothetical protein
VVGDRHRHLLGEAARELAGRRTWVEAVDELVGSCYPAPAVAAR